MPKCRVRGAVSSFPLRTHVLRVIQEIQPSEPLPICLVEKAIAPNARQLCASRITWRCGDSMEPALLRYRSSGTSTDRLRMRPVQTAIPMLLRGIERNRSFEEETHSVSVNACGGVLRLSVQVILAQPIFIVSQATASEASGIVTFVGQKSAGKRDISIKFSDPSVLFWGITFPGCNLSDRKGRTHKR